MSRPLQRFYRDQGDRGRRRTDVPVLDEDWPFAPTVESENQQQKKCN